MVQQATFNVDAVLVKVHNTKLSHRHVPRRQAVRKAKKKKKQHTLTSVRQASATNQRVVIFHLPKCIKFLKATTPSNSTWWLKVAVRRSQYALCVYF